jgi:electron transfer flavoprotein beta subunit
MEILVLVKRVPATDCKIKVGADAKSIDPSGVEYVLNPYDEFAVEEALKTKEAKGGTVTVLTLGPGAAQKDLRTCLAMGADKAVLLKHEGEEPDSHAVAEVLLAKIKELNPELILCGKQAVDGDNAQIGQRIATMLGWSCVVEASTLEIGDGTWTATRDIEGGRESIEGTLPAVVTCQKGLNEPRYPNLKGIMAAKKKPLEEGDASPPASLVELVSLSPPPERPAPTILGEGPDAVPALIEKLQNEAKVL